MVILKRKCILEKHGNICRYNDMIIQEIGKRFAENKSHHGLIIVKAERCRHHSLCILILYILEILHNKKIKKKAAEKVNYIN